MMHITFFTCIVSLCLGAVSFAFSLLFFLQHRKKVILYYAMMLSVIMLLVISRMLELYAQVIGGIVSFDIIITIIEKIAFTAGMVFGPLFCFNLIGKEFSRKISSIFIGLAIFYASASCLEVMAFNHSLTLVSRFVMGLPVLFGTYVALCLIAAFKLESLGNLLLNRTLKLFFILSLLILPPAFFKYLQGKPFLPYHLENSLALLTVTIVSIIFAFRFFNQPSFFKQGKLSDYFRKYFGTTTREEEIIQKALSGKSNNEIADVLCISIRTVESHMYNIFQKTGVKNRVQLLNLITTNRAD